MESLDLGSDYVPTEAAIHSVRYDFAIECGAVGRVLDASCGYGYGSLLLSRSEAVSEVVGIDRDPQALEYASTWIGASERLSFRRIDLDDAVALESLGEFDTIVSIETLEHTSDPARVLSRLKAVWSGRGPIIISYPNDALYYGRGKSLNPFHLTTGSWFHVRQWAEGILGPADWYFGSVASGFAVFPVNEYNSYPQNYLAALGTPEQNLRGRQLPGPTNENRLLPHNSLFYFGVWNAQAGRVVRPAAALYPTSAQSRMPDFFAPPRAVQQQQRPKLLLVADVRNWAYDNIAQQVKAHLEERFEIEIKYQDDYGDDWHGAMYDYLFASNANFIHFFWRETILNLLTTPWTISTFCKRNNISPSAFSERVSKIVFTASVYDHLFSSDEEVKARLHRFAPLDGLNVSSERLRVIYATKYPSLSPIVIEDGVDLSLYRPSRLERFDELERPLVIGWVGNSTWNSHSGRDPKGFHSILKPAIQTLREDGIDIAEHYADRTVRWRTREEMAEYYGEIDVLVCCSESEGTPNPVLEAIACGVPVVTTDVGIVRQALGPSQQQFVVTERSIESIAAAIERLNADRKLLKRLSEENLSRRDALNWLTKMPRWLNLFKRAEAHHEGVRHLKRSLYGEIISQRFHTDWVEENVRKAEKKAKMLEEGVRRVGEEKARLERDLRDVRRICPFCLWLGRRWRRLRTRLTPNYTEGT